MTTTMSTYQMARTLEQLDDAPEKIMFGKLLNELGQQSAERIQSAAKQVSVNVLREIIYQLQQSIESRKGEQVEVLARQLAEQGITAEELKSYLNR